MATLTTTKRAFIVTQTAEQKGTGKVWVRFRVDAKHDDGVDGEITKTFWSDPVEVDVGDLDSTFGFGISNAALLKQQTSDLVVNAGTGGPHTEVDNT